MSATLKTVNEAHLRNRRRQSLIRRAEALLDILRNHSERDPVAFRQALQMASDLGRDSGPVLLELLLNRYRAQHGQQEWGVSQAARDLGIHRRLAQKWRARIRCSS